jgi:phosphatidylserine decarboxylase
MQEAEVEDIRHYRTLGELFLRKLKSSSRSIHEEHPLVSPCDGRVLHCGEVIDGCLEQIKGIDFSLEGFLGADVVQRMSLSKQKDIKGTKLCFITLYLSPGDYHHFHSPASWTVTLRRHFPGQMLPVAQWAVRLFPGLFTVNERVALVGDWKFGSFTFSAVGAFNVGSISLAGDKELCTNVKGEPLNIGEFRDKNLTKGDCDGKVMKKGDYVGTFNLGSTIVLVFDAPKEFLFTVQPNEKVKFGQSIGYVTADVKPL